MSKLIAFTFFLIFVQFVQAHVFYFAFGEVQYNQLEKRFELTLRATGHDVEAYMDFKNSPIGSLESCLNHPIKKKQLELQINQGFVVSIGDRVIQFELIGLEVGTNDEANFYLISKTLDKPAKISVRFDFLMDFFPEQQNKLTIFDAREKIYLSFLPHLAIRTYEFIKL